VAGGRFEARLPAGDYSILGGAWIQASDGPQGMRHLTASRDFSVPAGKDVVEVALPFQDHHVSGRVVRGATGKGAEGVQVRLVPAGEGNAEDPYLSAAVTGAGGRFDVAGSGPGTYLALVDFRTEATGLVGWILRDPVTVVVPEGGPVDGVLVRVGRPGVLEGRVTDASGAPVVSRWIGFLPERWIAARGHIPLDVSWVRPADDRRRAAEGLQSATTDREGRYRITAPPLETGLLVVGPPEQSDMPGGPPPKVSGWAWAPGVQVGESATRRDVTLQPSSRLTILHYNYKGPGEREVLLFREGLPWPVRCSFGQKPQRAGVSEGWIPFLPVGRWTVEIREAGRTVRRESVELREGEETLLDLTDRRSRR